MKKRFIAIIGAGVLCFSAAASVSAFAAQYSAPAQAPAYGGYGYCGGGYSLMWNADGSFRSQADFEANLDNMIASGIIRSEDRAFYLERYEWCVNYGGGATGVRGFGGGCGMGRRMYR